MVSAKLAGEKAITELADAKNANDSQVRSRQSGDTRVDTTTIDDQAVTGLATETKVADDQAVAGLVTGAQETDDKVLPAWLQQPRQPTTKLLLAWQMPRSPTTAKTENGKEMTS
jgi:hypothetical protein